MIKKIIIIHLMLLSTLFATHKLMMNVSDLDLELDIAMDIGQFGSDMGVDSYFLGGSIISTDDGKGDMLISVNGLFMNDMPDVEGLRFGMGMKVLFTDNGTNIFLAAPFGMVLDYLIPTKKNLPLFAVVDMYYAPGALSFADAVSYFEARAEMHYELVQSMRVFFGYRSVNTNFLNSNVVFNQTFYGGAKLGF